MLASTAMMRMAATDRAQALDEVRLGPYAKAMNAVALEVLEANEGFYRAFVARDAQAMEALWAERLPVACAHPGWDILTGRGEVLDSWRRLFAARGTPERLSCSRAEAHVLGDVAFVTCHEVLPTGRLLATNVFAREDGAWRMVHHQASPIAPGQERPPPAASPAN